MRGVADKRDAIGNERTRHEKAERMYAPRADHREFAEMQFEALFQLGVKLLVRQRHDAFGLVRALGPYDRGTAARERQDGERPRGEKMLLGAAVVIALVRDIDDDRRLAVGPAVGGDASRLAEGGARAVGGDQQARGDGAAVRKRCGDPAGVLGGRRELFHRIGQKRDAAIARLRLQRRDQMLVLDHVRERFARLDIATEAQKRRPRRVGEPAVGDHHVEDRLRLPANGVPDADRLEQPPRGGDNRGRPLVAGVASAQRRIRNRHGKRRAERLPQRDRKGEAGKSAAGNQHIRVVRGHRSSVEQISTGLIPPCRSRDAD